MIFLLHCLSSSCRGNLFRFLSVCLFVCLFVCHGGRQTIILRPSVIYTIYCLQNSRWHWLAVSYWPDWTTATQCCTVLQPAAFRFWSGSFSRLQDDLMPSHYCVSCIGCPFNTESSTRWLCWPSRVAAAPQHRHTSDVISRLASVNRHFARLPSHYCMGMPFARTDFARQAFRCSAPAVWNSLPETIISVDSLSVFKSRLKTYFFHKTFE